MTAVVPEYLWHTKIIEQLLSIFHLFHQTAIGKHQRMFRKWSFTNIHQWKIQFQHHKINLDKIKIPEYNYQRSDWDTVETTLAAVNIDNLKCENINATYSNFTEAILQTTDETIPKYSQMKSKTHSGLLFLLKANSL